MIKNNEVELPPPIPADAIEAKPIPIGGLLFIFGLLFLSNTVSKITYLLKLLSLKMVFNNPLSGSLKLLFVCVGICVSLMVVYSFFSRSKSFVNHIHFYLIASILVSFLTLTHLFFMLPLMFIVLRVVPDVLLMVYFKKSSRVRRTFVKKSVVPDRHFYFLISVMLILSYLQKVV